MPTRYDSITYKRIRKPNVPQSGNIENIEALLKPLVEDASEIYADLFSKPKRSVFERLFSWQSPRAEGLEKLFEASKVKALKPIINHVRAFKSDAEISNMRQAGQASGRAFTEAMRQAWTSERDLAAFLEYKLKKNGCDASAYVPVVAGGQVCISRCLNLVYPLISVEWEHDSLRTQRRSFEVRAPPCVDLVVKS